MAEEQQQRWQEEGRHRLCANNCGFFGSPSTLDLCSKCYCDRHGQQAPAAAASPFLLSPSSASASAAAAASEPCAAAASEPSSAPAPAAKAGRCASCRKRVGLTGFTCRCGVTFCGTHRYPERHACGFDFKAAGRDAISRANPVVKGDKLKEKI